MMEPQDEAEHADQYALQVGPRVWLSGHEDEPHIIVQPRGWSLRGILIMATGLLVPAVLAVVLLVLE
jgi:hypothetical protein